ncbi:uncharacterized protein [Euphorbia lathyris]|uniref:uncharacterized protein n=1 Tax=Euphorbia lathyris TaxID=212925 RepID=UPI0033144583
MESDREKKEREGTLNQPPQMSPMEPVTHGAYGGGMYAYEPHQDRNQPQNQTKKPASETQSADGPVDGPAAEPKHKAPPSTGDRDVDITGQSYIQ